MIRKTRSQLLAAATTAIVVSLATLFACMRNQPESRGSAVSATGQGSAAAPVPASGNGAPAAAAGRPPDAAQDPAGRTAYERLKCSSCHSIAGAGNTNSPLDGVGTRLDKQGLKDWTIGGGAAKDALPAGIVRMKARFAADPDLDALVDYLATLR